MTYSSAMQDWTCVYCGSTLRLIAVWGGAQTVCPHRFDGKHPVINTTVSSDTNGDGLYRFTTVGGGTLYNPKSST